MATFDLRNKSGLPKLLLADRLTISASQQVYGENIDIDTENYQSFLVESIIRIKNAPSNEVITVTAYLNLQESDTPGSGYVSIPQGRLQTECNTLDFGRDPNLGDNDFISKTMCIGAFGNKRYIRAGLSYTLSRSVESNECYIVTYFRSKDVISSK